MAEPPLHELLAAGREGVSTPAGTWRARVLSGARRNRIELARADGAVVGTLEGRWLRTTSVCFSADERWIAVSGYVGGVSVWRTDAGAPVAFWPEIEADPAGDGRLPLLFACGGEMLVCGGKTLTFIDTTSWKTVRTLDQPCGALWPTADPLRVAAFEAVENTFTRWVLNVKSFEIEGAERLRETRIYFGLLRPKKGVS